MPSKYQKGQLVTIKNATNEESSLRDSALEPFVGRVGRIADYYWVSLGMGKEVFYIYTIKMGNDHEEVVVHEDEIEAHLE